MIHERREEMKKPEYVQKGDFLTLLLLDDLFKDNEEMMTDECLTFMVAATQTTTMLLYNTIYHLTINPEIAKTARDEVHQLLNGPATDANWTRILAYDELDKLQYTSMCLNEGLRIEPPVPNSSPVILTENEQLGQYQILKGTFIGINMRGLHHNSEEWQEPEKFIPERFDPQSKYYLTPKGTKRHQMSFGPFLGGKRVCLGKTFAENMTKCILPIFIHQFKFEFQEKEFYEKKPTLTFGMEEPVIMTKLIKL